MLLWLFFYCLHFSCNFSYSFISTHLPSIYLSIYLFIYHGDVQNFPFIFCSITFPETFRHFIKFALNHESCFRVHTTDLHTGQWFIHDQCLQQLLSTAPSPWYPPPPLYRPSTPVSLSLSIRVSSQERTNLGTFLSFLAPPPSLCMFILTGNRFYSLTSWLLSITWRVWHHLPILLFHVRKYSQ